MDETLREELNLPKIGGEIVAHFERRYTLRRWRLGSEIEPHFIRHFAYDTILNRYYSRKTELRRTIESFRNYRSNIINIFEYYLKRNQKPYLDGNKYNKIKQCLIQANEWSFNEELISELLLIIHEIKLFQVIYETMENKSHGNQADLESIEGLYLNRLNPLISEYEEGIRKVNIRLRGLRKVFAEVADDILNRIKKESYDYSSSPFSFKTYDIVKDAFKSEPQKLYRANWYFMLVLQVLIVAI